MPTVYGIINLTKYNFSIAISIFLLKKLCGSSKLTCKDHVALQKLLAAYRGDHILYYVIAIISIYTHKSMSVQSSNI